MWSSSNFKPGDNKRTFLLYVACICFCIYSLTDLVEKSRSGYFRMNVIAQNRTPSLSLCLPINSTNLHCRTEQCSNLKKLFEFIESKVTIRPSQIIRMAHEINLTSYFDTNYSPNNSVIFIKYRSICVKYYEHEEPMDEAGIHLANYLNLSANVYLHEQRYPEVYNNFLFYMRCSEHGCSNFALEVWQFKINYTPELMKCINYAARHFDFEHRELIDSKEVCLFECLKSLAGFRPIDFLYTAGDKEPLCTRSDWTKLAPGVLGKCKALCSPQNCNTNYFLVKKFRKSNHTSVEVSLLVNTKELFFISSYDMLLQLLSFFCLIFSTSILWFLDRLIYLSVLLTRSPKLNLFKLAYILSWTFILSVLCLSFIDLPESIGRLHTKEFEKNFKFELEKLFVPFKIYFCFDLRPSLNHHYLGDNQSINYLDQLDLNDLINFPFNQSEFIESIYLDDGHKRHMIDLDTKNEIYFKIGVQKQIEKCLGTLVTLKNSESEHFRALFPTTRLKIRYKQEHFRIYFTHADQQLTQANREIDFARSIVNEQKFHLNCERYRSIVVHEAIRINCTSRTFCFDRCFNHLVYLSTQKLPFGVIAEQEFALLRNAKLNFKSLDSEIHHRRHLKPHYLLNSNLFKIQQYCSQLTTKRDCEETDYKPGSELDVELRDNKLTLNIFPDLNIQVERYLYFTDYLSLISKGITFYSVLLGINFFDLIRLLTKLLNLRNKFKEIYLFKAICFVALAYHLKSILSIVFLESKFVESFFISKEFNGNDFPSPNLCFTNPHMNSSRPITGDELNRLTRHIAFSTFVESVQFLNDRSEYEIWHPNESDRKVNFKIEMFYLYRKKCFKIIYLNTSSYKSDGSLVNLMRINFKRGLSERKLFFFSSNRNPNSVNQFNQIDMTKSYLIDNKLTYIRFHDSLQFFFRPVLFFVEGYKFRSENYLSQLKEEFRKRKSHATTLVTLTSDYHHLPINNTLFELFFEQEFKKKLALLKNFDFERYIYKDIILARNDQSHSMLFKKVRFKRFYVKERKDTVVSFLCDLLSAVSLWLGGLFGLINRTHSLARKLISTCKNTLFALINVTIKLINVTIKLVIKIDQIFSACKRSK